MPIVCPHCATSYAIDREKLGEGRAVRCARCKEVWTAVPEPDLALAGMDADIAVLPPRQPMPMLEGPDTPLIDSPSIAVDWADATGTSLVPLPAAPAMPAVIDATSPSAAVERRTASRRRAVRRTPSGKIIRLPLAAVAMSALAAALLIWRGDVVRLMPQTAGFYKTIGLDVNVRGLSFRDVRLGRENADGKTVLVVEGAILDELKRAVEIPRLRFVVRDAQGAEIYAWNAAAEQKMIQPGERAAFRSLLTQPPEAAHAIDVRFFHKRDLAAGAA